MPARHSFIRLVKVHLAVRDENMHPLHGPCAQNRNVARDFTPRVKNSPLRLRAAQVGAGPSPGDKGRLCAAEGPESPELRQLEGINASPPLSASCNKFRKYSHNSCQWQEASEERRAGEIRNRRGDTQV